VQKLAEKLRYVDWNNGKRKESFAVFAKSFSRRIDVSMERMFIVLI